MNDRQHNELLERYVLLKPLAQGGMAEVFLARQRGPAGFERQVVIKRVLPHLAMDERFITMFLDEARLAARLLHPNIVSVSDFGSAEGTYYLCMEYLDGYDLETLQRRLRRKGRQMPPTIAALIASAVCDGLHHAHTLTDDAGQPLHIVHRDITPSNLLLTFQGAVKILDFGVAKARGQSSQTEAGGLKGKPLYMSPEQVQGEPLDGRSDLFALGLVLYVLLTGTHPFRRDNALASMHALMNEEAADPASLRADLPDALCAILRKALERQPRQRYASAQQMRADLDAFLAGAQSTPSAARLQVFMRELMEDAAASQDDALPVQEASGGDIHTPHEAPPRRASRKAWLLLALLLLTTGGLVAGLLPERPGSAPVPPRTVSTPPTEPPSTPAARTSPTSPPPEAPRGAVASAPPIRKRTPVPPEPPRSVEHLHVQPPPPEVMAPTGKPAGWLELNCVPWCHVTIDGRDTGRDAPLLGYPLAAGSHRIHLVHPPTGATRERDVEIEADRTLRTIIRF